MGRDLALADPSTGDGTEAAHQPVDQPAPRVARNRFGPIGALVCALLIIVSIGPPLVGRGVFLGADIVKQFAPWSATTPSNFKYRHGPVADTIDVGAPAHQTFRDRLVDDHEFALWDPYPAGGTPLASTPNSGVLGPLDSPNVLLGIRLGAAWSALLRLGLTALAMFALLRRFRLSTLAAWCGAIAWCTCGFFIEWNNWPQANVAAWLPLLFLVADRVVERRRLRDIVALAAVFAAMLLEGYPPLVVIALYALVPFVAVRWWDARAALPAEAVTPAVPGATAEIALDGPHAIDGAGPDGAGADGDDLGIGLVASARERLAQWRDALRSTGALITAGLLGAALAAIQVLPFLLQLGNYDLSYRTFDAEPHVPFAALVTLVFPDALGRPAAHDAHLPTFPEVFSYAGAATIVLLAWALLRGRPRQIGVSLYRYCVVGVVLIALGMYLGGPVHAVVARLPGLSVTPVSRQRMALSFLIAMLCAFGVEHVVAGTRRAKRSVLRAWVLTIVGVVVGAFAIERAVDVDRRRFVGIEALERSIAPAVIALVTIACIVVVARRRQLLRAAAVALPVLLAVESLLVTMSFWPRNTASADLYPVTPTHAFLQANIGHERLAAYASTLFPSSTEIYKLRTVSGHGFSPPAWRDLIHAGSPGRIQAPTFTLLGRGEEVATAPVFDRLAARYFVDVPERMPYGEWHPAPEQAGTARVPANSSLTGTLPGGPLRAVSFRVVGAVHLRSQIADLVVTVRDQTGRVVATGGERMHNQGSTTYFHVPVAGEGVPTGSPLQVSVGLRADRADAIRLGLGPDGRVGLGEVVPNDDGLRLVFADPGSVIYQRLNALSRVRWASRTVVVTDPVARVNLLAKGLPADTTVLDRPGPAASGASATVTIRDDSGDKIVADVQAGGSGYVVVADALQHGWSARLDGHAATLHNADHALVAVAVPAGHHVVELFATPRGWRLGIAISAVAVLVALLLLALSLVAVVLRRRRAPGRDAVAPVVG